MNTLITVFPTHLIVIEKVISFIYIMPMNGEFAFSNAYCIHTDI